MKDGLKKRQREHERLVAGDKRTFTSRDRNDRRAIFLDLRGQVAEHLAWLDTRVEEGNEAGRKSKKRKSKKLRSR